MTVDQVFIIKKLQNLDEMLVAYSAVTRMPFAICDDESFNDQVWIFTDQDKMNVARRTCGYIGTQFWNQGRTQEIKERVLHL